VAWGPLVARSVLYAGVLVAVGRGSITFLDPEWKAGARSVHEAPGPRLLARAAALFLVLAPLLLLLQQLAALEMTRADIPVLLAQTAWGQGWSQLTLSAVLASVALVLPTGRTASLLLVLASLGVAVAMGGLGHAAADERWPIGARALDAVHVAAMGAWIGGLLVTLLLTRVPAFALRDAAWRTFSRTATLMAPVTVFTGLLSGARLLFGTAPAAILASDYGRLLGIKTLLVLVVLIIGASQRRRIGRGAQPETRRLWTEVGVAAAVLLVTAVLTGSEPPGE
jgi:copper resistance protein D